MIRSMTGFGRATALYEGRELTVELRSVNNRFLDCTVKLPRAYSFAEDAIRQRIKARVSRGKVDVFITMDALRTEKVGLNRPVLEDYLSALHGMVEEYGVKDDISVSTLCRLPDVFTLERAKEDEDAITAALLSVTDAALDRFDAMREKEGEALANDLRAHAGIIRELVKKVEARSPVTLEEYRAKLTARMQETLQSTQIDESRILMEAAIYADKIAVDEETVRLTSHLSQMEQMLLDGGAIGRKLDFLMQEMNREANTIGSKGNDIEQARTVVDIKAELEKIREQLQNIE